MHDNMDLAAGSFGSQPQPLTTLCHDDTRQSSSKSRPRNLQEEEDEEEAGDPVDFVEPFGLDFCARELRISV